MPEAPFPNNGLVARYDFGSTTLTIATNAATTVRFTDPVTTDPAFNLGPIGPVFGWFAYSHNDTNSGIAMTYSIVVSPQGRTGIFSAIGTQALFTTAIASGSVTQTATFNAVTGVSLTGHFPYAEMRYQFSATAATTATITLAHGMGLAAF